MTFGIRPDRAETGYGWLALSEAPGDGFAPVPQTLAGFVEKPDAATAERLLAGGMHLWNAGIFLFSTEAIIAAFETYQPSMLTAVTRAVEGAERDLHFLRLAPGPWAECADISIDYAVMEKADNLTVVPYGVHGRISAVGMPCGARRPGCARRRHLGPGHRHRLRGYAPARRGRTAGPGGHRPDGRDRRRHARRGAGGAQGSGAGCQASGCRLKDKGAPQAETLPRDYRPWGWFESLVVGERFQVKRIHVHPGAALSLQSHHHRSEHWIVVAGTAKVTIDDTVTLVTENESVFIPLGAVHRMENPGKVPMVLIEVQTGSYLGEDDIIRYQDAYARGHGAKG